MTQKYNIYYTKLSIIFFSFLSLLEFTNFHKLKYKSFQIKTRKFTKNFEYHNYQREYLTEKIKQYAGYELSNNEAYFLNGIIRKFKPNHCLELGVSRGGSSIIILNALKDINNSFLVSLDINENCYNNKNEKTGYAVNKYFPELAINKWQLFTGRQPHIFLSKLKMKFDFLFLDTVHYAPGEMINFIEVLPFLEENTIVVLHDIIFHLPSLNYYNQKDTKIHPSQIYLISSLIGEKIILASKNNNIENIGAVILYPNQEKYYLNYFLLLLSPWNYIPNDTFIDELIKFVKTYYKKEIYISLFNRSIEENKLYIKKYELLLRQFKKY